MELGQSEILEILACEIVMKSSILLVFEIEIIQPILNQNYIRIQNHVIKICFKSEYIMIFLKFDPFASLHAWREEFGPSKILELFFYNHTFGEKRK